MSRPDRLGPGEPLLPDPDLVGKTGRLRHRGVAYNAAVEAVCHPLIPVLSTPIPLHPFRANHVCNEISSRPNDIFIKGKRVLPDDRGAGLREAVSSFLGSRNPGSRGRAAREGPEGVPEDASSSSPTPSVLIRAVATWGAGPSSRSGSLPACEE